ncbi:hypothetical protein BURMUCGD2M_0337 [Burkholderia multivorans CGD2M]|uniref:Uncharacterized protein n=1 Tax=Burkholderia multivorans CGD2 TaxID=513052 RepID=B9BV76_9BURK|nr:hypothetical protein BURMUCGD2_0341 [Burkholderia multivorans CGD2]EEE10894.1 hypothetical protein BURMUCGD2M_0337 [Burkholderia multivorans CGD2M]
MRIVNQTLFDENGESRVGSIDAVRRAGDAKQHRKFMRTQHDGCLLIVRDSFRMNRRRSCL